MCVNRGEVFAPKGLGEGGIREGRADAKARTCSTCKHALKWRALMGKRICRALACGGYAGCLAALMAGHTCCAIAVVGISQASKTGSFVPATHAERQGSNLYPAAPRFNPPFCLTTFLSQSTSHFIGITRLGIMRCAPLRARFSGVVYLRATGFKGPGRPTR